MSIFDLRLVNRANASVPVLAQANERGEQLIASGIPVNAEETRKGNRYATMATTALAALVVRPTGTAGVEIYNNTGAVPFNGGPAAMVVTRLFTHWLVMSTTALGTGASIYACVSLPKAGPTNAALAINSLSGKPALGLQVLTAVSQAITDNGWFPYGNSIKHESAGAVVPGGGMEANVDGRLIVPPGCSLLLHVVSGYVADTFTTGAEWVFEPLTLA